MQCPGESKSHLNENFKMQLSPWPYESVKRLLTGNVFRNLVSLRLTVVHYGSIIKHVNKGTVHLEVVFVKH